MSSNKPIVGISCDIKLDVPHLYHLAGDKYVRAVAKSAHSLPVMLPSLAQDLDWDSMLDNLDGVMLTGSYSNIQPILYGLEGADAGSHTDLHRDATVLPLIQRIVEKGIPLLAICRGFQEINVAYGGSLHLMVHEVEGLNDHREDKSGTIDEQYAPSHQIKLMEGGMLSDLMAGENKQMVNSIHMQGINKLGNRLNVEATAEDGLIEAFSITDSPAFTLAVQWHPEWKTEDHPFYKNIFSAFAKACEARRLERNSSSR